MVQAGGERKTRGDADKMTIYVYLFEMYIIKFDQKIINQATAKPVHKPQTGQKGERVS